MNEEPPRYGERVQPTVEYTTTLVADERLTTAYQSLKVIGFFIILLGPILPLTIFLWKLALG